MNRLEVGESGTAALLSVGDSFTFVGIDDKQTHVVTKDVDSHFEYDGRPNKILSKDQAITRVGKPDEGEIAQRAVSMFDAAVSKLNKDGDVSAWMLNIQGILSRVSSTGAVLELEKLEKRGTALFSRSRGLRQRSAIDTLSNSDRKKWVSSCKEVRATIIRALSESYLRSLVSELVKGYVPKKHQR